MLRSMFSAVSGLRAHQTMMDVTGDNIANVNTTGFKSSRTTFQESFAQAVRGGTGSAPGQGGVNGQSVGLGAQVAATDRVMTQGASQTTGRATDLAIQNEGFFVVETDDGTFYTRAGAFSFDSTGQLVGPGGERVQGTDGDIVLDDIEAYTDISIGSNGLITGRDDDGELVELGQLVLARFPNNEGLVREGNGLYSVGPNAGPVIDGVPGQNGLGSLQSGALEMSNVDLAQEFTNLIISQRGFQANARSITTSDELLQELVNLKR